MAVPGIYVCVISFPLTSQTSYKLLIDKKNTINTGTDNKGMHNKVMHPTVASMPRIQ